MRGQRGVFLGLVLGAICDDEPAINVEGAYSKTVCSELCSINAEDEDVGGDSRRPLNLDSYTPGAPSQCHFSPTHCEGRGACPRPSMRAGKTVEATLPASLFGTTMGQTNLEGFAK